jgi:hypothetical protein
MTRESPMIYARALTDADLQNKINSEERRWLREHPLLWLRILTQIRSEVEAHIAQDHLRLSSLKPSSGETPSEKYLIEKNARDERTARRMKFMTIVKRRQGEVAALCGVEVATPMIGDVIKNLVLIMEMIDQGKLDSARDVAQSCIEKLMSR